MADLDLIPISPSEILNMLKKSYYDQTGETIQIGSSEFAASAAQSYAWSVLLNNINENTRNRFIDTATGSFLDAIASNYGIDKRPSGYHASAKFRITFHNPSVVTIPANGLIVEDSAGNQFTNNYETFVSPGNNPYMVLQSIEPGSKYNGIPEGEIANIVQGTEYITTISNITMTAGGTDGFSDDDLYRGWLKTEIQSFAGAGTYQAYEARAKNADSRVLGVYVLRQNDTGYEKGKVKIYILTDSNTDTESQVKEIVQNTCSDDSFRPIGDLVEVEYSPLTDEDISIQIQVTYPARFVNVASSRNNRILNEYRSILLSEINKPFRFEELCALLTKKDGDGIYAVDAKPINLDSTEYPRPIYPVKGGRINIQDLTFSLVYDRMG